MCVLCHTLRERGIAAPIGMWKLCLPNPPTTVIRLPLAMGYCVIIFGCIFCAIFLSLGGPVTPFSPPAFNFVKYFVFGIRENVRGVQGPIDGCAALLFICRINTARWKLAHAIGTRILVFCSSQSHKTRHTKGRKTYFEVCVGW